MKHSTLLLATVFAILASLAFGAVVEHTFHVGNYTIERLCQKQVITVVNGLFPGPTIRVREGDTLIVHVHNNSTYNCSIHWHGVFQLQSAWSDGPTSVTQCPMQPQQSYTYKFNLTGQEGTLWWHAHVSWIRATVHGALIIYPREGRSHYPFPKPYMEVPILLGEWWNGNVVDIEHQALAKGVSPNISDAFTINGEPGDLYPCSRKDTYKLMVKPRKKYLLRIINAALNNQLFFKIANHTFTVVGIDATYTDPYHTDVVVVAPGQTTDVLMTTTHKPTGSYYMAAHAYVSAGGGKFTNTTTTGILQYEGVTSSSVPKMPILPHFNDTSTAHKFYSNLTGLENGPNLINLANKVDEHMFITVGFGWLLCGANSTSLGHRCIAASMNNVSFQFPSTLSILQAYYNNVSGIYTDDFPNRPPVKFDYSNSSSLSLNQALSMTGRGTRVKKLKYNTTVEIVLQNTAVVSLENHPIHLHGNNFHVLAQGFGNYKSKEDAKKFNLVNPQQRNTIAVPSGGWAVIRFRANNPGAWLMHCHLDVHLGWGLATVFLVENGPTPETTLPPPPPDLPEC